MKKSIILGTSLAAITALGLAVATAAEEPIVNVFNWSDYIDEGILADFEKETGIKVVYDVFDSNEVLETKLLAGGTGYDVVVPSASFMARQIEAGAFMPLDTSKLPNEKNMWPVVKKQVAAFDPGNKFSVNYMWGTTGIGLNIDMVRERIGEDLMSSWDMILDPEVASKLQDCGIFWLDAPNEMLPVVLNYVGRNPASFEKEDIKTAMEVMSEVRSTVRKFHSSEYINALANGDICVAVGWSGDVLQARERAAEAGNGVNVDYVIPWEGAVMWFDQLTIPVDAPHPENAHKFIDYLMRPEVAAKASNYIYFANGNLASQPMLNEDVINDGAIYPDERATENLYTVQTPPQSAQRVITREWTRLKSGQ